MRCVDAQEGSSELLSLAEVAELAGVSEDFVSDLDRAGVISPVGTGYPPHAVREAMLVAGCVEAGLPLDAIGAALSSGHLSIAAVRSPYYERWGSQQPETWADVARDLGISMTLIQEVHRAVGFGVPSPEDHPRGDDRGMLTSIAVAVHSGFAEDAVLRVVRVYGESMRRITRTETELWHEFVELPLERAGASQREILEAGTEIGSDMMAVVDASILSVYHRMQEHAWMDDLIEHVELALVEGGVYAKPDRPTTMAFMDISGYTALTEERGDRAAADLASRLASIVQRTASAHHGEAMKWLGDGVMFRFRDAGGGVRGALEVVEATGSGGLPPAHVGMHTGAVVERDGDVFGRTVNLASRISGVAGPGEVLCTADVAEATGRNGVRFDAVGAVELKGVADPVELLRASRA
jgi:class 3 adenylate cyclase